MPVPAWDFSGHFIFLLQTTITRIGWLGDSNLPLHVWLAGVFVVFVGWHVLGAFLPDDSWERLGDAPGISRVNRKWKNRRAFSRARIKPFGNLYNEEHLMRGTVGRHTFVRSADVRTPEQQGQHGLKHIKLHSSYQLTSMSKGKSWLQHTCRHLHHKQLLRSFERIWKEMTADNACFSLPLYLPVAEGILKDFNSSITFNLYMAFLSYSLLIFRWLHDYWRRFVSSSFTRVATFILESICLTWLWFTAAAAYVGVRHSGVILDYTPDPFL